MWSGRCVVTSEGLKCKVKLEDPNTGELFAVCAITEGAIEPVSDSSRYYVIKIEDGSGRHAFIGMGFTERSDAFDFSAALQDHKKYQNQRKEAEVNAKKAATQPKVDYSLKEGQKIHVEFKTAKKSSSTTSSNATGGFSGLLPPPPGSRGQSNAVSATVKSPTTTSKSASNDLFNFDAFTSSPSPQPQQQQQFSNNQFGNTNNQFNSFQNNQFQPQVNQQNQFNRPNNQFGNNQFNNQFNSFQNVGGKPQTQQQSNDIWGDFTGSSTSSPKQQQQQHQQQTNNLGFDFF